MPAGTVHGSKKLLREERVEGRAGRALGVVALVSERQLQGTHCRLKGGGKAGRVGETQTGE